MDIREWGVRAANVIVRKLKGEIKPVMAWANKPMLPHIMCQGTHAAPNKPLQERCKELEAGGVLAASVFVGFPHADIHEAGLSAVVCTDGKLAEAEQYRDELLERAWTDRADWVFHPEPLAPTIARAKAIEQGPVVLLDHYDNTGSGGTMDTTAVLAEVLRQELDNVVFYAICDPQAALEAAAAGGPDHHACWAAKRPCPPSRKRASRWKSPAASSWCSTASTPTAAPCTAACATIPA